MVVRLHSQARAEERGKPRSLLERDVMVGECARSVLVPLASNDLRKMLHEVTAARDVQDLRAAADGEHRHVPRQGALEQRELGAIALVRAAGSLRLRLLPVPPWDRSRPAL